jgi:Zn-dependent protease
MFWVAGAGPGINLAMALGWALLFKLSLTFLPPFWAVPLARMADAGISINVALMVLNLLPLPPLDGGRMLVSVLPPRPAWALSRLEPYGIAILLVAMISGVGSSILWPMFVAVRSTILATIGF